MFDCDNKPLTPQEICNVILAAADDNRCYSQLADAIDSYQLLMQSHTAHISFDVVNADYHAQQMAFGLSPHSVRLPQLSTNKWWVTRMFDTICNDQNSTD